MSDKLRELQLTELRLFKKFDEIYELSSQKSSETYFHNFIVYYDNS